MLRPLVLIAVSILCATAADVRTGVYRGRAVTFENVGGLAVFEGDIILGSTTEIEAPPAAGKVKASSAVPSRYLWPGGKIPYTIDSALSSALQQRILAAIDHWNTRTPIRISPRGSETNYVRFTTNSNPNTCSSAVGMSGGAQQIRLPDGCGLGPIIHEIGHAVGLWHEQSRADRNRYLTVLYENIDKAYAYNFDPSGEDGEDAGFYDFNSLMHYGAFSFSRDGILPAMETVPAGIPIGQRVGLSAGDIDVVQRLYGAVPTRTTIASTPSGLKLIVDGVLVDDMTSFDWTPGTVHEIRAPFQGDSSTRYYFGSWSDGGAETHAITASAGTTVYQANFVRQHRVTPDLTPANTGTVQFIPASADGFYNERSVIEMRATPFAGYVFASWNIAAPLGGNPRFYTVASPQTMRAAFVRGGLQTFLSEPAGRRVIVDGSTYTTPVSFAWNSGTTHTVDVDTTQPDFIHYNFNGWSDGGPQRRSITAGLDTRTYTAKFTTLYSLTLGTARGGRITASPASSDGFYEAGSTVQLQAAPASGYVFTGWADDLAGGENPINVVMEDQKIVSASFATSLPAITPLSAASYLGGGVAPGEILTIFGADLGPESLTPGPISAGKLGTNAGGTEVTFNGVTAPMLYSSANQVGVIAPFAIRGSAQASVRVLYNGRTTAAVSLPVVESRPSVFTSDLTGHNNAAALNQDGSVNSASRPARRGEIVALFATGGGQTAPAGVDGQIAAAVYPKPLLPVYVRIGGQPAPVHYAGAAPGAVAGAMQINAQIPEGIRTGPKVPVRIVIGDAESRADVTIAIE